MFFFLLILAPADKNEYDLARNYGLDISMPEANFAVASAAQKEYQKRCNFLYRDFMKNMSVHIKQEQTIKKELRNLKKEKMLNSHYSLYRTDGKDLFSTAKKNRETLLKKNELSSSFFDDLCFNPWGLDSIIDEDLIRPKTAPAGVTDGEVPTDSQQDTLDMPPNSEGGHIKRPSLAATLDADHVNTQVAKVEHLLQSQSHSQALPVPAKPPDSASPTLGGGMVKSTGPPKLVISRPNSVTDESSCDGEVDIQTERTRARNITIDREKFLELQKGDVDVKLKNKDGAFLVKPVKMNYDPTGVDAVFIAKDPSKERMALVRQKTNWKTPTVAAELKINNRIAIQKSLIGKSAKKTTVAEIFNSGRDRKTRHFRIISKSLRNDETDANDRKESLRPASSPAVRLNVKSGGGSKKASVLKTRTAENGPPIVIHEAFTNKATKKQSMGVSRENSLNDSSTGKRVKEFLSSSLGVSNNKRSCESASSVMRSTSQASMESHDILNTSGNHRVSFARGGPQESSNILNRSHSSMSMREGNVQFKMTDADMNKMLDRLIEGKGEKEDYSNQTEETMSDLQGAIKALTFMKRLSRMSSRNKRNTPSDVASSTGTATNSQLPRRINSRQETDKFIRESKQKDDQYLDTMDSMRRRVALGASKSRSGWK